MIATIATMSKKKPKGGKHKPRRMVGLPRRIAEPLEEVADARETNVTELVKLACIEFLERLNRWPPKPTA